MAEMRAVQQTIAGQGGWSAGPTSLMEVLELDRNEVVNCRVVRWLLDPLGRHQIGGAMLRELAAHIELQSTETGACTVEAEVPRAQTRADIVIAGLDAGTVVIEAKIDAPESHQQGKKLEEDWPEAALFIFLTIPGLRPPSTCAEADRWKPLSWRWLADRALEQLNAAEAQDPSAAQAQDALRTWAHATRRSLT